MFDRIVFRRVRRVVRYPNFNSDLISRFLKVFFENIMAGIVTSSSVAQNQQRCGIGIIIPAMAAMPSPQTVAGEFTRIPARPLTDIARVSDYIVNTDFFLSI